MKDIYLCMARLSGKFLVGSRYPQERSKEREGRMILILMANNLASLPVKLNLLSTSRMMPCSFPPSSILLKPPHCSPSPIRQTDAGIACELCNGRGWLVCDFCNGQKTNVKADNRRIYRRCPSCRAIGFVLCSKCKVFKCVTFPNYDDGEEISL